jgi:hypothetical protein
MAVPLVHAELAGFLATLSMFKVTASADPLFACSEPKPKALGRLEENTVSNSVYSRPALCCGTQTARNSS